MLRMPVSTALSNLARPQNSTCGPRNRLLAPAEFHSPAHWVHQAVADWMKRLENSHQLIAIKKGEQPLYALLSHDLLSVLSKGPKTFVAAGGQAVPPSLLIGTEKCIDEVLVSRADSSQVVPYQPDGVLTDVPWNELSFNPIVGNRPSACHRR
jgi:hypothetical protein